MCTLLGLNHFGGKAADSEQGPSFLQPQRTNRFIPRFPADAEQEECDMVFKEGTFKGEPPEHFDGPHPAWLETAVADALSIAGDVDASDVTVTCKGTRIILSGSIGSAEEADRAVAIAAAVKEVREVDNRLSWL
jgi:hypothetical protein